MDCGEPTNGSRCKICNGHLRGRGAGADRTRNRSRDAARPRALELAVLYRGGCTLQEIGTAIGLTRERVRQLIRRVDPDAKESGWHRERLENLSPTAQSRLGITREEYAQRRATQKEASKTRLVTALAELAADLGRTPTQGELARRLGYRNSATVTVICKSLFGGTYREATRALYALVGLVPRGRGSPGHVSPRLPGTHCRRGHPLSDAYVWHGTRRCRQCQKERYRSKVRARAIAD